MIVKEQSGHPEVCWSDLLNSTLIALRHNSVKSAKTAVS